MYRIVKKESRYTKKMKSTTKYNLLLITTVAVYFISSKLIFEKVYETSETVIDELFHIPQGLAYCNGNFSHWDTKITTLPGLYLVTAATIGPFLPCNTYNLRFINLIGSGINLILFLSMLKFIYGNQSENHMKIILQALNLAILPPLYFFSHVYYTDTLSLLFLMLFSRLCFVNKSKSLIFISGMCSVIMRQTNVVWVAMVLGHRMLNVLIKSSRVFGNQDLTKMTLNRKSIIARDIDSSKLKRYYGINDAYIALKYHVSTCFTNAFKFIKISDWLIIIQQVTVILSFVVFLLINGSIVVGDKKAHSMTIHLPQLLYFLLFYGVFGLPYVLGKLFSTMKLIVDNRINVIIIGMVIAIIVHFNTIVHPYLLADNRHYTFYVWNRWFGKYDNAIYATIPTYVFLLFSLYDNLKDQNCVSFLLPYSVSLFLALALQRLVEIRYFLVPYIILRLRFVRPSLKIVVLEFVWYFVLNALTFNLFFTKEIIWKDFNDVQRIIW